MRAREDSGSLCGDQQNGGWGMDEAIALKILPIVCHSFMPQILSYNALHYSYYSMLSLNYYTTQLSYTSERYNHA